MVEAKAFFMDERDFNPLLYLLAETEDDLEVCILSSLEDRISVWVDDFETSKGHIYRSCHGLSSNSIGLSVAEHVPEPVQAFSVFVPHGHSSAIINLIPTCLGIIHGKA